MNPASGQLFIFRNKGLTKLKMLYWEDNGYWLFYKRLSKGKFILPIISDAAMGISRQQFSWLLSGLSLLEKTVINPLKYSTFIRNIEFALCYNSRIKTQEQQ